MTHRTQSQYVHALYYPSWRIYRNATPSSMDCEKATHILYAFVLADDRGELCHLDEYADLQVEVDGSYGCIRAIALLKFKFPHLKVLLSIGGGTGSQTFPTFSATYQGRRRFALSVASFVSKFGFDGIDIDWEHPSTLEQGCNYVSLLEVLRAFLPTSLIFSALPAGEWCLHNISMDQAAQFLDRISLMCYDFAGSWSAQSGHQAQLYASAFSEGSSHQMSANSAVEYLLSCNVPPDKILIGIPVYGRSFIGACGPGQPFTGCAGEEGVFEYEFLPLDEVEEIIDRDVVAASCYSSESGFMTYDTPETVAIKAQYVKDRGLGGMFYWTGTADSKTKSRSLVTAGYNALFGK